MNRVVKRSTKALFAAASLAMVVWHSQTWIAIGKPLSDGENSLKAKCSICHGLDGSGNTPMGKTLKLRDLRSEAMQKQSADSLLTIIDKGKGKMPPFGESLSQEQMRQLVAHIRDLAKKR